MGILKHFVLPTFALVHAASIYACKDLETWAAVLGLPGSVSDQDQSSIRQNHMLGCLRGFNVAMLTLCGWGALGQAAHSDTRQAIALAETALFSAVAVDALRLGKLNVYIPAAHSLLAFAGSIISFMEPGIFTKDHNKSS